MKAKLTKQERYYCNHRQEILTRKREKYQKLQYAEWNLYLCKRNQDYRMLIFNLLGNRCAKCGFSDPRALQIDHIHGGGEKDRLAAGNYQAYLKKIIKSIQSGSKDYQLLCANCNWIKRYEKGE